MLVDLDQILNRATLDVWALEVTYNPRMSAPARAPFAVRGAWTNEPVTVLTEIAGSELEAAGYSTTHPVLGVRRADLGLEPRKGDRVTVQGKIYEVWDIQPDTSGWIELVMRYRT